MKLTMLFLTLVFLQVSAATKAQITLNEKNVPLQKALKAISKQSGYDFIYTDQDLKAALPVSLSLNNATIELALQQAFDKQPLQYRIEDKTVMVKKKDGPSFPDQVKAAFAAIDVHGTVLDEKGQPLPGVTVKVKGGSKATITDVKGGFDLKNVNEDAVLQISFIGFVTKEVRVTEDLNGIQLNVSESKLDEVQVIAYGKTSERLSTGNVATVTSADIEKSPVSNPILALQGRVAGLNITQSSGVRGGGVVVQIQGQNSIANGNYPFYVVDGVPYTSELLPNLGNVLGQSGVTKNGSPLTYLNPSDIESISVLKDADATAIYGSRAANGAILITTKKGKAGQATVNVNLQQGFGTVANKLKVLNLQQYLQMKKEAYNNDGLVPSADPSSPTYAPDLFFYDTARSTDWQKTLFGKTTSYSNFNGSISGGNKNTQYLIGATYHQETSVFSGKFNDQNTNIHFNLNSGSEDQKFLIQFSGSYGVDNNKLPNSLPTNAAINLAPNSPELYNPDGSLNWGTNAQGNSTFSNPLALTLQGYNVITKNLIANSVLTYHILPNLDFRTNLGYTDLQANETVTMPLTINSPESLPNSQRLGQYSNNNISSWIIEPQLNYRRNVAMGTLDILAGASIAQTRSNGLQTIGFGYNSDAVIGDPSSSTTLIPFSSTISQYKYAALFTRINYNIRDKYLLDLTARRDGSSRFGSENQFHNFGAVGAAWLFSNENFIRNKFKFFSFGKLKVSYGTTGNDQIGDYTFLSLYNNYNVEVPYQNGKGLLPNGLSNAYLQWELTKKINLGLDLGFFGDRILLSGNYYRNRSSNELLNYNLPSFTGFGSIQVNFPATVQNSGLEFTGRFNEIKASDFQWSTSVNMSLPRNKLIAFPNLAASNYAYSLAIGQSINRLQVFHYAGVNSQTGLYEFKDSKGQLTSNPDFTNDRTALVNTAPTLFGGIENTINYKSLSLSILFSFVRQQAQNNRFGIGLPGSGGVLANQPISILNPWQKPGDMASVQRYSTGNSDANTAWNSANFSDAAFSDASYARLKNLSLSWQIPASWIKSAHFRSLRIYGQGQNFLTFTKFVGLDPETLSFGQLPPLKVWTFGLQASL